MTLTEDITPDVKTKISFFDQNIIFDDVTCIPTMGNFEWLEWLLIGWRFKSFSSNWLPIPIKSLSLAVPSAVMGRLVSILKKVILFKLIGK